MSKNSIVLSIIVAFAFVGAFVSCKKTTEFTKIDFDSIVVDKRIPLLLESDTTLPFADVNVKLIYPKKFRNEEDLARLQQIFLGTFFGEPVYDSMSPQQAMNNYITKYTDDYKDLSNAYYNDKIRLKGEMPNWYWYSMSRLNKIVFQNDSLLAYAVEYSDYTGGAHGSYRLVYINIDLNNLVTLSEEDLFKPDYYKLLTDKLINNLMKQYNVSTPDSLVMHGFLTVDEIMPNNNFYLNDKGINYAYNQYEIAPYSMGVINITVPYSELEDILIPDGIITRFFLNNEK